MKRSRLAVAALAAAAALSSVPAAAPATAKPAASADFVRASGADLTLKGKPFRFAGTNNYYLMYKSPAAVADVFARAKAADLTVVRTWGFLDIGDEDGTNSIHHKEDGVYFQYWDGAAPAYNDGPDGLVHLDQVLASARAAGIKLIIPFTNNWSAFGGMDQYVRWAGGTHHDDFYTDARIRGWYKDWISHLLNRTNTITGVKYKDDPTVMAWELANEPRCKGSGNYPTSASCTVDTVTGWADEMSRYVKSIAPKQLVSAGDEGFYCTPGSTDPIGDCSDGVDTLKLTRLPAIDVMSFHLYPDHWSKSAAWGTEWIKRHLRDARRIGKPAILGEFGLQDKAVRNPVYQEWLETFVNEGGDGVTYWMLAGTLDDGTLYPDYDGFTVYCPSPVCTTIGNTTARLKGVPAALLPPVADDDTAVTTFDTPVTVDVAANDIAYLGGILRVSLDLDPAKSGIQQSLKTAAGTYTAKAGKVTFQPKAGFTGRAEATYVIRDLLTRLTNKAKITVVVRPDPGAPVELFTFDGGTEGWAPGDWQDGAGAVSAQNGALAVDATGGGWFGAAFPEPIDLSGKGTLKFDLTTVGQSTSTSVALQTGEGYSWCQSAWGHQEPGVSATVEADLISGMSCTTEDLADVRGLYVWFSPGAFTLDSVRAE
ncbi:cellulase family glycosylhydrolase [Actinocorallia sp. API 0066]|uniref:cellulase family glycosylhydrolase n=1 Tax=Actinocorallia sp. API 0066 TaxID=2896846 RepID=UPI001E2D1C5A|nr:cellulase family glycosylhydrolase [Actinocorallia sp. API 0066]MCD0449232.1 cellulase family glycosylhydrolase [Actinocorallia sp. API 0066]